MHWLRTIAREILGLFVDDGSMAVAILVWLVLAVPAMRHSAPSTRWTGPVLFAGLVATLVESVLRFARRK